MFAKTLLMALATVLVVLPHVQVLAQGETADDPFVVTTCEDLDGMRNNLDAFYVLGNNIVYSGPQKLDSSLSYTLPRGSRTDERGKVSAVSQFGVQGQGRP